MSKHPALVAALCSLAGCLSVPDEQAPMCTSNSDCDVSHGEVCQEGTCWGNPPAGSFAAVLSAPNARTDLVPREVPTVGIPPDGWMGDLALDAAVSFGGKLVLACPPPMTGCDPTPLGATVTITRPSRFHGGPGFHVVATVEDGASSFSIPVPATGAGDEPYTITIVPAGRGDPGTDTRSPATLAPPLRMTLGVPADRSEPIELGGADLPTVTGTLMGSVTGYLSGYRVVALGRWDASAPAQEVSTVAHTGADGLYSITLSDGLSGPVEIVATPADGDVAPTLHLANVDSHYSSQHALAQPPGLGHATDVVIPVLGAQEGGAIGGVAGARVEVTSTATVSQFGFATMVVDATTDDQGKAKVSLLGGEAFATAYKLSIIPPAGSSLAVVFGQPLVPAAQLDPITLGSRVSLAGVVTDAGGAPLGNVAVTVHPSVRFTWSLEAAPQAFVAAIPAATAVTPENGEFVVWIDPIIADTWGNYDVVFEPPASARAPAWTLADVDVPRDSSKTSVPLGNVALPNAAYVHGRVVDPTGVAIAGAELKLYTAAGDNTALCMMLTHAPDACPIPAQLQGRGAADDQGVVRLSLPRP